MSKGNCECCGIFAASYRCGARECLQQSLVSDPPGVLDTPNGPLPVNALTFKTLADRVTALEDGAKPPDASLLKAWIDRALEAEALAAQQKTQIDALVRSVGHYRARQVDAETELANTRAVLKLREQDCARLELAGKDLGIDLAKLAEREGLAKEAAKHAGFDPFDDVPPEPPLLPLEDAIRSAARTNKLSTIRQACSVVLDDLQSFGPNTRCGKCGRRDSYEDCGDADCPYRDPHESPAERAERLSPTDDDVPPETRCAKCGAATSPVSVTGENECGHPDCEWPGYTDGRPPSNRIHGHDGELLGNYIRWNGGFWGIVRAQSSHAVSEALEPMAEVKYDHWTDVRREARRLWNEARK